MEEGRYTQLLNLAKTFLTQKLDYSRLTLAEKMSMLFSKITFVFMAIIIGGCLLSHLSNAMVLLLTEALGSAVLAYLIVSCVILVVLLLVYAFRMKLIVNPITRCITKLLVEPENNDKNEVV